MATAYSYVRFSSPEQAKGDSLRRQLAASQHYADRHGLTLDRSLNIHDLGVSAFRGDNSISGKLGTFISAIDSGQIQRGSYLLVESIDRLSRNQILKSLNLFTSILSKGITIVTLSDNKVYTEDSINNLPDLIYSLLIMTRAHEESAIKSSRVAQAWVNKRQRAIDDNIKLTHRIPSWLVLNNNHFTIIRDRAELVQRIFQMSIDGHGGISIAKQLNQERIPTWRGGDGWRPTHIRGLLHTSSVYGDFIPGKMNGRKRTLLEPICDYYPVIISKDMFFAAQHAMTQRTGKGGKPGHTINLFATLLRCLKCDGSIVRLNRGSKNPKSVFVCDRGRRGVNDCHYSPWPIPDFEHKVLKCVREVDLSLILGSEASERVEALRLQLVAHQGMLADAEDKLNRLVALAEQGANVPRIVERIQQIQAETEKLTAQCIVLEKDYGLERQRLDTAKVKQADVIELMKTIDDVEVRTKLKQQLRGLVERIDVDLIKKQMFVFYIGQRRMMPISPDVSPKMFKLAQRN